MSIRFAIDPPDEDRDELVNPEHEAETIRQQAWDLFVASLRDYAAGLGWPHIFWAVQQALLGGDVVCVCMRDIKDFADLYGWPSTLRALAQAIEADEQFKKEAEGRR